MTCAVCYRNDIPHGPEAEAMVWPDQGAWLVAHTECLFNQIIAPLRDMTEEPDR